MKNIITVTTKTQGTHYRARVTIDGKRYSIGTYATLELAQQAINDHLSQQAERAAVEPIQTPRTQLFRVIDVERATVKPSLWRRLLQRFAK